MKILWVKPGNILPLDSGGQLRTYNILRCLAVEHELTYLSYYGGERDEAYEREILKHIPGTVTVHTGAPDTKPLERYLDYARRLTWRAPYAVSKFTDKKVQKLVADWVQQRRFDVAVCDFLSSTLNFPEDLPLPTALFQPSGRRILWKRQAEVEVERRERMGSRLEYQRTRRTEPKQW